MPDRDGPSFAGKQPRSADQILKVLDTIHNVAEPEPVGPWDGPIVRRLLARPSERLRLRSTQTSLLALFCITTLVALWLAVLRSFVGVGCLTASFPILLGLSIYRKSAAPLYWLPLATACGLIVSIFLALPIAPAVATTVLGTACFFATSCFALQATRAKYRKSISRRGVLFVALGYSALGGLATGLMVAVPVFLIGAAFRLFLIGAGLGFDTALEIAFPFFFGLLWGVLAGIPLGFVGDALVAYDARHARDP